MQDKTQSEMFRPRRAPHLKRRQFLQCAAASTLAVMTARRAVAEVKKPMICVFSKHLQYLDYPALAAKCRELGLEGIDLTVRSGGHVLPERVEEDLPKAVEAIRAEGLEVPMITTRYKRASDAHCETVLKTASALDIPYFRIGDHSYDADRSLPAQMQEVAEDLKTLAALCAQYDMTAGYHNHSGFNRVGAPLWDLYRIFEMVNSPRIGSNFDLGHTVVEGAYGDWDISTRLMAPQVKMVAVKDFVFEGNRPKWVPLGEGIVPVRDMLRHLHDADFTGPISLHFEYNAGGKEGLEAHIGRAVKILATNIRRAGYR